MKPDQELKPSQDIDTRIAEEVFGFKVWKKARNLWYEGPPEGERPLRKYSKDMEWAWEVAKKMNVTLIPIVGGLWFAFIGGEKQPGWESPQALLKFFESGDFGSCGAAAYEEAPLAICVAALKAVEKRKAAHQGPLQVTATELNEASSANEVASGPSIEATTLGRNESSEQTEGDQPLH